MRADTPREKAPNRIPWPNGRRRLSRGAMLAAALWVGVAPEANAANPWAQVADPSPGPARVIGEAAAGCISGAQALPDSGQGFLVTKRTRHRFFGHPELVEFIRQLGAKTDQHIGKRLVIGDLGQPRGGPMPNGHRSHQSGLDADIWLWMAPPYRQGENPPEPDEAPSMVSGDDSSVDPGRWGQDQGWLLKQAASNPAVDRIFVNAAIKAALCTEAEGDRGWLAKVRPWWHHRAHLHVRLRCPPGSPTCAPQPPLPAGDGCGSELAWWFSDEAKTPRPPTTPPAEKPLPKECNALIADKKKG
jgi:penicillin-insensitive murein DD-endopeptidase